MNTNKDIQEHAQAALSDEQIEALVPWQGDPNDPYFDRIKFARIILAARQTAPVAAAVQGITITELKSIGKALTEKLSTDYLDDPDGESTDYHAGKLGGIMALWREVEQRIAKPPADAAPVLSAKESDARYSQGYNDGWKEGQQHLKDQDDAAPVDRREALENARNAAYPVPNSQHTSVNMRAVADRTAFTRGYQQGRASGLEEAAKAAENVGRPVGAGDGCTYVPGTSADAARAIRALNK